METPSYDYTERPAVRHPYDDGVWLGTLAASGHDADAVISICRLGVDQVPAAGVEPRDHLEAWLIDTDDQDANPNLYFVLADIASAIAGLRAEGRRVLVYCVAAHQRTPSAAIAYARRLGVSASEAVTGVRKALPDARGYGPIWDAALDVPPDAVQ